MRVASFLLRRHTVGVSLVAAVLLVVVLMSLRYGALHIDTATVWNAFWDYDHGDSRQIVVRELRLHRTVIGVIAGASFAVAGALTQGVTRNPLGAPGILGVNAGAAFAVVTAIYVVGVSTPAGYVWFAFAGALGATMLVYAIASAGMGRATPIRLVITGAVISALLSSWTATLLLLDMATLDQARFWLVGSISGRSTTAVLLLLPVVAIAMIVAFGLGRHINALGLGTEVAVGLGQRTTLVLSLAGLTVVALAGSAVALAGPVAFVGLAVPHIARSVVGPDYRWIIFYSLLGGPCLLLSADVVGRLIVAPQELQVGIVSAALGAPFLIHLVRRTKLSEL